MKKFIYLFICILAFGACASGQVPERIARKVKVSRGNPPKSCKFIKQIGGDAFGAALFGNRPVAYHAVEKGFRQRTVKEGGNYLHIENTGATWVEYSASIYFCSYLPKIEWPLPSQQGAKVNAKSKDGYTPLHEAAKNGDTETVQLLISKGAKVNARAKAGQTPLAKAVEYGHTETAELLKKHGGTK